MFLNKLYFHHQKALIHAAAADDPAEQARFESRADRLAADIAAIQRSQGANPIELLPAAAI
jgi:hypothetical protein